MSEGVEPPAREAPRAGVSDARARRTAALAVAAVLCVFFAPALLGPDQFVYHDTGRLHGPMKRWIADELSRGRFPEWNPYAGLGTPVIATAQDSVQHPFTLLLVALPAGVALKAWILLSSALAAAGAFLWARALGGSAVACAVAALGFALSGPLVSSSDNVTYLTAYAALPWVFAAAHLHARRGGPATLLGVAGTSALCAAAGDPQGWGIAIGLLPFYSVAVADRGARAKAFGRGVAAAVVGAVAAAPFVLPVILWVPESQRAAGIAAKDLTRWDLHPARLLELGVPELFRGDPADPVAPAYVAYAGDPQYPMPWFLSVYLGSALLALAALAVAVDRRARAFILAAALFAWAALGRRAGFGAIASHLPVLNAFRYWEKLSVWIGLFAAIAAARGVDALLAGAGARRTARAAGACAAVLLAVAAVAAAFPGAVRAVAGGPPDAALALAGNVASGAARAGLVLGLLALVAAALARGRLPRVGAAALVSVVALDLFGGNAGAYVLGAPDARTPPPLAIAVPPGGRVLSPFAERDDRWPERGRVWGVREWLRRMLGATWNVPLGIGADMDYVGLRPGRWAHALDEAEGSGIAPTLALWGFGQVSVPGRLENAARAGVKPPYRIAATDPELPAWLVDVPHRPRAYVAATVRAVDAGGALRFVRGGGVDGVTVVEGPVPDGYAPPAGEARIVRDEPGATVVEARADGRALVVLSDLFAPGWTAEVDGRSAQMVRANALVRGVWVDAGAHAIRFRYRTPGLGLGWAIALAEALALGAWEIVARRRARATP